MASLVYDSTQARPYCIPYLPGGEKYESPEMKEKNAYVQSIHPDYFLVFFDPDTSLTATGGKFSYPRGRCWEVWRVIRDMGAMVLNGGRPAANWSGPYVLFRQDGERSLEEYPLEVTERLTEWVAQRDGESFEASRKRLAAKQKQFESGKNLQIERIIQEGKDELVSRDHLANQVSPGLFSPVHADVENGPSVKRGRKSRKDGDD